MKELVVPRTQRPKAGYAMPDASRGVHPLPQLESDTYRPAGKLAGKTALVTGGDSGIGAAVAIAYAKEGADVAVAYYDSAQDAQQVAGRIAALGRRALTFGGDVGDEAFCQNMAQDIAKAWGKLDILVNNAGEQTSCDSILDLTQEQLVRTFQSTMLVLSPTEDGILLETLFYADEIRAMPKEAVHPDVGEAELGMARQLVQSMEKPFDPAAHHDEYQQKLRDLINKKIEGKEIVAEASEQPTNIINLMDALKQSLQQNAAAPAPKTAPKREKTG